ncbi:hypothetical protein QRX60_29505 [Amycolatopsis mongoliensis]|uniref:Uncharacterized protein n=1 Tax=Amycolatopsis mongoliensis TaxID=715475 RepID=A0A9Y2NG14_9PSEU|nr:hypothetical protein [Amycolatopsis sp. 4-36]WIX98202.1 hypothetical protein QRX60_29505 [Amycolatopsis sp. 4-36]
MSTCAIDESISSHAGSCPKGTRPALQSRNSLSCRPAGAEVRVPGG